MKPKEQLMYLLEHYNSGDYAVDVFVNEFYRIFNFEADDSDLSQLEISLFSELSLITGRFSSCEEDLKIPNAYFSETDVKKKAKEIYFKLTNKLVS